jgi:hypothetical protein
MHDSKLGNTQYKSPISVNIEIGLFIMANLTTLLLLHFSKELELGYFHRLKIILIL